VFNGLESINEVFTFALRASSVSPIGPSQTHRTTAAIGALTAVGSPLTNQTVWLKGQRHLVPLLDLCLPGIDINDATKTISTCLFIVTALQFVKIGDLKLGGVIHLGHDAPSEDVSMTPEGSQTPARGTAATAILSEEEKEEDLAVKQATAGFAGAFLLCSI
jgi:proteasome activator subunit 4